MTFDKLTGEKLNNSVGKTFLEFNQSFEYLKIILLILSILSILLDYIKLYIISEDRKLEKYYKLRLILYQN